MRVLIVDDHLALRMVIQNILGSSSVEVVGASNGHEALDLLANEAIDVVFMDIRMPGLGGIETVRRLRAKWPDLPVFMLSSSDRADDIDAARAAGASGYIVKPAYPAALRDRLMAALGDAPSPEQWKVHA